MNELRKYFSHRLLSRLVYTDANTVRIIEEEGVVYLIVFTRSLHLTVIKYNPKRASKRRMRDEIDLMTENNIDGLIFTIMEVGSEEEVLDALELLIHPDYNESVPIHNLDGYELLAWNKPSWTSWIKYYTGQKTEYVRSSNVMLPEWRIGCYAISRNNVFVSGIVALFSMVAESIAVQYYMQYTVQLPETVRGYTDLETMDRIYDALYEYTSDGVKLPDIVILAIATILTRTITEEEEE